MTKIAESNGHFISRYVGEIKTDGQYPVLIGPHSKPASIEPTYPLMLGQDGLGVSGHIDTYPVLICVGLPDGV